MTVLNVRDANTGDFVPVDLSNPSGTIYVNDGNTGEIIPVTLSSGAKGLTDYQNVVVIDPGGNGDYTTQAEAAAAITDDDASHVYNVFVFGEAIAWATWANRPYIGVHGGVAFPGMIPVAVRSDWADPLNAMADIQFSTGLVFPGAGIVNCLYIMLWEGPNDPDDYASLFASTLDPATYSSLSVAGTSWDSAPTSGTAYIIGVLPNNE